MVDIAVMQDCDPTWASVGNAYYYFGISTGSTKQGSHVARTARRTPEVTYWFREEEHFIRYEDRIRSMLEGCV